MSKLRAFMPRFTALLLVLLLLVLLLLLGYLPVSRTEEVLPLQVAVTNARQIGVNMTNETAQQIDFGAAFPGAVVTRRINLSRGSAPPAAVHLTTDGELAPWLTLVPHDFQLVEPTQVALSLTIPEGAAEGRYSGTLTIRYTTTLGARLLYSSRRASRCALSAAVNPHQSSASPERSRISGHNLILHPCALVFTPSSFVIASSCFSIQDRAVHRAPPPYHRAQSQTTRPR